MAQLLFIAAYVIDRCVDAIDRETTKASVDEIFKLKLPNLPSRTLDGVDFVSHCAHTVLIRRERDGVVCGSFADADVMVARKYKTKLIVE
eukprot:110089-Pleurochrysis_carterae.AAC.1